MQFINAECKMYFDFLIDLFPFTLSIRFKIQLYTCTINRKILFNNATLSYFFVHKSKITLIFICLT